MAWLRAARLTVAMVAAAAPALGDPPVGSEPSDGGAPSLAAAQERSEADPEVPIRDAGPPPTNPPAKRPMPDYDGRGPTTTTRDDLLWIPRVLVAPAYLAYDFLLRRPLGAIVMGIEHSKLAQRIGRVLSFGESKSIGWAPTFRYDHDLLPSVGVYLWWDDAIVRHNHLRFHFGTWGPEWISTALSDRYDLGASSTVALRAAFSRRSDWLFFGLGPDSTNATKSRYQAITFDVGPEYDLAVTEHVRFKTTVGVRKTTFGEGTCCETPTLHERIGTGEVRAPPRLIEGYAVVYQGFETAFDTREGKHPARQSGIRIALNAQPSFDVSRRPGASWVNYGATVGAFWDITKTHRVLGVSASTLFSDPIEGGERVTPFTELVTLGGFGSMRGFLPGRLVDRSAAVVTVGYEWPVWAFLDGTMQVSTGNVFGPRLRGFAPEKLRLSTAFGLRTNNSPDHQFEILTGFGTDTFDAGGHISSFRLVVGATRGF